MVTVLKIEGMSCQHCQRRVKQALESISGVQSAEVSLEQKTATVSHDENTAKQQLIEAVEDAGYEVV